MFKYKFLLFHKILNDINFPNLYLVIKLAFVLLAFVLRGLFSIEDIREFNIYILLVIQNVQFFTSITLKFCEIFQLFKSQKLHLEIIELLIQNLINSG